MARFESTAAGTTLYSGSVTGSDSLGNVYTGHVSISNLGKTVYDGVLVTPRALVLSISAQNHPLPWAVSETDLIATYGGNLIVEEDSDKVICTPVSPDHLPASVKIGDSGVLSTLVCSDQTTTKRAWSITQAKNGGINLIEHNTETNSVNAVTEIDTYTYTLDSGGALVAIKMHANLPPSGFNLDLTSP